MKKKKARIFKTILGDAGENSVIEPNFSVIMGTILNLKDLYM